jgi:predicted RecA/RadA family phage recombinase
MADFIQQGDMIDYTPGSAVTAGDVIVVGDHIAVALADIAANVLGALRVTGVFSFPKTAGASEAIADGKIVYWTGTVMTETATANTLAGKTVGATVDGDTSVKVRLTE